MIAIAFVPLAPDAGATRLPLSVAKAGTDPARKEDPMSRVKLLAGAAALCLAVGVTGVAMAASGAPSGTTTIRAIPGPAVVKINRYIQDSVRWNKDVYTVKSGGTLRIVNDAAKEGPHTFTVVAAKDRQRTPGQRLRR